MNTFSCIVINQAFTKCSPSSATDHLEHSRASKCFSVYELVRNRKNATRICVLKSGKVRWNFSGEQLCYPKTESVFLVRCSNWLGAFVDIWLGTWVDSVTAGGQQSSNPLSSTWLIHFPCYWPLVRGIHRSPMDSLQKGPETWRFAVCFDVSLTIF